MKRIPLVLAILAWATLSHAYTSKIPLHNASGDEAIISVDATTGNIEIQNPDDEEGYGVLRSSDIGSTVMAYSTNLAEYAAVNPVADALTRLTLSNAELGAVLGSDEHTETITLNHEDEITLETRTASDGYTKVIAYLNPQSDSTFTFAEHGFESIGDMIELINISSVYNCTIASDSASLFLPGTTTLKPGGRIYGVYGSANFFGSATGAVPDYISKIDGTGGCTIQGLKKIYTATGNVNLTYNQLGHSELILSGTGDKEVTLPDSPYIIAGDGCRISREGTSTVTVRSLSSTAYFRLPAGTSTDPGDVIQLDADTDSLMELTYVGSNRYRVVDLIGTTTDEGAYTPPETGWLTEEAVIGYYRLENNDDDETANEHDLTPSSMAYITDSPVPVEGTYAGDFATAYLESSDAAFDVTLTGNFSIVGWVYFDAEQWGGIASMSGTSGNRGWRFYRNDNTNAFQYVAFTTSGDTYTSAISETNTAPISEWIHFALVVNGTDITLYLNGTEETGNQFPMGFTSTAYDTNANFRLGQSYVGLADDNRYLNGKLDAVYVIGRELTANEVHSLYENVVEAAE